MARKMKAAVLTAPSTFEIRQVPVPELKAGEIEVEVKACGVCGSDIGMWRAGESWSGAKNLIMGHEFCGIVVNPGDSDFKEGDRVLIYPTMYCGECEFCRTGRHNLCTKVAGTGYVGFAVNGGYAERYVGPARLAHKIPEGLPFDEASLMDPFSVAYHALKLSRVKVDTKALVVGSGVIGQMMGSLLRLAGCSVIGLAYHNFRKVPNAQKMGDFTHYFDENDPDVEQKMKDATDGGFDVIFDCAGTELGYDFIFKAVRTGGQIVIIGCPEEKVKVDMMYICQHELDVIGSPGQTEKEVDETLRLLSSDKINGSVYITDHMKLDDLQLAFKRLTSRDDPVVKIIIEP